MIWAWLAQRLTGIVPQALGAAILVTTALGIITGGLAWLRHDARADEASGWVSRLANARVQDLARLRLRERQSEAIGVNKADEWARELSAAQTAQAELEAKLAAMKANPVCWPKGIVGGLNR